LFEQQTGVGGTMQTRKAGGFSETVKAYFDGTCPISRFVIESMKGTFSLFNGPFMVLSDTEIIFNISLLAAVLIVMEKR
jgi:hypothetical protein